TVIGVQNIDANVKEAAKSMGMTDFQMLKTIDLPLALPLIMSGIRLASVYVISWATLASYIGAGGLGDFVFNGLNLYDPLMIVSAAVLVTAIALFVDFLLSTVEKKTIPKGLKVSREEGNMKYFKNLFIVAIISLTVLSGCSMQGLSGGATEPVNTTMVSTTEAQSIPASM